MTIGKTIASTRRTFVGKVMSLLLNMLSRLVITFLPRSKHLLISWLQSPFVVILEPPKINSDTVSTVSPSISHEVMGPDTMIFVFWVLSFKPTFSLSTFTFIKRLLSSSSLSALWVVSSACLRLLIFLPAILIPACVSSSPTFLMMYSPYKLNKQGDNIQPWRTSFPIWNQSVVPSDQINHSVVSDTLRPHELQHARPPCPTPTPGVHWDSSPSSQWCHAAISSSVIPFSTCPQSLPASWQIYGERMETITDFILFSPKSLEMMTAAMELKEACSLEKKLCPTHTAY